MSLPTQAAFAECCTGLHRLSHLQQSTPMHAAFPAQICILTDQELSSFQLVIKLWTQDICHTLTQEV
jgi:hypothetical protein